MRSVLGVGVAIGSLVLLSTLASCGSDPKPATESPAVQNTADDSAADTADEVVLECGAGTVEKDGECVGSGAGWVGAFAVKAFTRLVDKACACRDAKCIEGVTKELTVVVELADQDPDLDANDAKKLSELGEKFVKCAQVAMTAP